jgi:hypothetical protein
MDTLNLRTKLITEIDRIPEERLEELYNFIHYFRLGVEVSKSPLEQTMQFAGCWNDLSDEIFNDFNDGIKTRSQQYNSCHK